MDINSLAHTKWNCKYHIVFAPKYRRKIIYGQLKRDIANILTYLVRLLSHFKENLNELTGKYYPTSSSWIIEQM